MRGTERRTGVSPPATADNARGHRRPERVEGLQGGLAVRRHIGQRASSASSRSSSSASCRSASASSSTW